MSSTCTVRPTAIVAPLFWLGLCAALGCGPNLERDDGSLRVSVSNIGAEVQGLRLEVTMPALDALRVYDLTVSGSEHTHVIAAIPAGDVVVQVFAQDASGVVTTAGATGTIVSDQETVLQVRLTEDAAGQPFESTLVVRFGPIQSSMQAPLQVRADTELNDWSALKGTIQTQFPDGSFRVVAKAASLSLDRGASVEVEKLQDIWRGPLSLSVLQNEPRTVGSAQLAEDSPTLALTPAQGDLAPAFAANGPPPQWTISGTPALDPEQNRVGYVQASVTLRVSGQ